MKIKVTVEGFGTYQIDNSKVNELIGWLSANEAVSVEQPPIKEVNKHNEYTGRVLLND